MNKCNASNLLKTNGLKLTKQRVRVLEIIISKEGIFSATDLFNNISREIDLVTIYRILSLFKEKKIIREILSNSESKKYEMACIHNPIHPHFSCRVCGKLYCMDAVESNLIPSLQAYCKDYILEDITIQLSGICSSCK